MWDVTPIYFLFLQQGNISTHTSRVGCDYLYRLMLTYLYPISTHTSRVGCDSFLCDPQLSEEISTHTSRVGCDCYI